MYILYRLIAYYRLHAMYGFNLTYTYLMNAIYVCMLLDICTFNVTFPLQDLHYEYVSTQKTQ